MAAGVLALRVVTRISITALHPLDVAPLYLRDCALCWTFWWPLILCY